MGLSPFSLEGEKVGMRGLAKIDLILL